MTKPHILFIIPGLNVGGAERHTVDLSVRLRQRGFTTSMIVHGRRRSVALVDHPGARNAVFLDLKGMSDPIGWLRLRREVGRASADIIVGVNQMPLIVSVVTRLLGGTKARVFCIFHTTVLRANERRLFFLFRWLLWLADGLIFVSANQRRYWVERGLSCKSLTTIFNGIDLDLFLANPDERAITRQRLGLDHDDLVVGLVAAFRPEKNHESLIFAMGLLRDRGVIVKAIFVGDGPTRPAAESLAEELGLMAQMVFVGEQGDVRSFMLACDAGVLCSVAVETFSLSALEFLASGIPMLMSDVGGAAEIVYNGVNGYLFDPGNHIQLADRIEDLRNPIVLERLTKAARPSVERLSIEAMIDQYVELFA